MKNCASVSKILWKYVVCKGKGKGHPRTGHEGPEGEQLYSCTLPSTSALNGGEWSTPRPRPLYPPPRKDPVPIVQEAGWAPWIRSPDRPARSESLYRLSYCGPPYLHGTDQEAASELAVFNFGSFKHDGDRGDSCSSTSNDFDKNGCYYNIHNPMWFTVLIMLHYTWY